MGWLMSAEAVIREARGMIGWPWRHQGRRASGIDCAGLVILAFARAGWPAALEAPRRYGRDGWDDVLRSSLEQYFGAPLSDGEMWLPGDVPLFALAGWTESHIGVFGDHPHASVSLIHASRARGCVVESGLSGRLALRIIDVFRPAWQT